MNILRGPLAAIAVAALLALAMACAQQPPTAVEVIKAIPATPLTPTPTVVNIDPDESPDADYGYASLLEDLRSAGVSAEEVASPLAQYSFSVGGNRVSVRSGADEGTIHVFEFPDATAVGAEASYVSTDGWTISVPLEGGVVRSTIFEWMETPHFYKKGKLIVVHIGDDDAVPNVLVKALGPQFAGGQSPPASATKTPTPRPPREWDVESIQVHGSTVTVMLRVYAGIDVGVTLDGAPADDVRPTVPVLEYVFLNVTPGQHFLEVRDVVGHSERLEVAVVPPTAPPTEFPEWLQRLIRKFETEPVANPPLSITRYKYKGQAVYFIPQRCCDIFSDLYDASGNMIAHPDGGITGRGDGRAPDFHDARSAGEIVWEDTRTQIPSQVQVPAPIESVEVLIMESFPPQYSLVVKSGLPNACVTFGGYRISRSGETVRIEIINWKPSDAQVACAQVYKTVETRIPLGSDFDPGKTYTVEVNDVTETLIAQ